MSDYNNPNYRSGFEEANVSYGDQYPSNNSGGNSNPSNGYQGSNYTPPQNNNQGYSNNNQRYNNSGGNNYGNNNYNRGNNGGYKGGGGGGFNKGGFGPKKLSQQELEALVLPKAAAISGNKGMPEQFMPILLRMCHALRQHGFVIRTGWSEGTEQMLAKAMPDCELYTPWKPKENGPPNIFSSWASDESKEFAKRYCPEWGSISEPMQAVYSKNARLVLGKKVTSPCQIVIIWSEDGVEANSSRTPRSNHAGHIAAMANAMHIPVININNPGAEERLRKFLEG